MSSHCVDWGHSCPINSFDTGCTSRQTVHPQNSMCVVRGAALFMISGFVFMKMLGSNLSNYDVPKLRSFLIGRARFQWEPTGGTVFWETFCSEQVSVPAPTSFRCLFAHSIRLLVFQSNFPLFISLSAVGERGDRGRITRTTPFENG